MGDIYESLAVVVFLWPAFITAGAAGYMGLFFLSPPITWNRQAFLCRPGAVLPVGAVSIFLAYLTPCSSKKSGLF